MRSGKHESDRFGRSQKNPDILGGRKKKLEIMGTFSGPLSKKGGPSVYVIWERIENGGYGIVGRRLLLVIILTLHFIFFVLFSSRSRREDNCQWENTISVPVSLI